MLRRLCVSATGASTDNPGDRLDGGSFTISSRKIALIPRGRFSSIYRLDTEPSRNFDERVSALSGPLPYVLKALFHSSMVPGTMEKLHELLSSMKPSATLYPDGFPSAFYACFSRSWIFLCFTLCMILSKCTLPPYRFPKVYGARPEGR